MSFCFNCIAEAQLAEAVGKSSHLPVKLYKYKQREKNSWEEMVQFLCTETVKAVLPGGSAPQLGSTGTCFLCSLVIEHLLLATVTVSLTIWQIQNGVYGKMSGCGERSKNLYREESVENSAGRNLFWHVPGRVSSWEFCSAVSYRVLSVHAENMSTT